ncbi:MAG TPA: helix-hairpin-helix domain-containing protein [Lacibacter sp.]|nr:helix-hairpin-helix domain-containing protein [Lacibacter sp.]HMO89097.1 helix-hairpin-helix domain-containing protein [Lacibacter sp.]HMP85808.1 helix-hairpin-helix domain-containing protein [Lacibacter sp.]
MLTNSQVADVFSLLGKLMDIHGENPFKAKSYSAAAFAIDKLPVPLTEIAPGAYASYKGIGDSAARKITELLQTGTLRELATLVDRTPEGVLEMLRIKGLGPKKIATIWKEMEIESLGELLYACNENRLLRYKGFGEKTQAAVKESIEYYLRHKNIYLYADVESYAQAVQKQLEQQFPGERFQLTGELRRQLEIIQHLEWVTTVPVKHLEAFLLVHGFETSEINTVVLKVKGPENICLLFYPATALNFGSTLFGTSAAPAFLEAWGPVEAAAEETAVFSARQQPFVPPFLRETPGCTFPDGLVTTSSIRGIIHSHSQWSDGTHTLEEMAQECMRRGWEYLVISDHSKSAGYANGLSVERIREQHRQIDELNKKLYPFRIFKSIESDILGDGSLDYEDHVLQTFDLVIASVHSNLRMTEEKAMQRLLRAIAHPATTILGHMTGRLLLSRPGYPVNHQTIIDACVEHNVVIELNAHPRRLDIDWRWIPYALEKGALLSINPDAHEPEGFNDVRYGVLAAQKGGLTASRNLSSFNREEFENYLAGVRNRKNT